MAASTSSSKWQLQAQVATFRSLARTGFWLHSFAPPKSPNHSFKKQYTSGMYGSSGPTQVIDLYFYVPKNYDPKKRKCPVVVNFHGGGFTLGAATDDRRWAGVVLRETNAIFVSVEYRLAPEYPFPVAVEDGYEAILHLACNSDAYGIDAQKIAVTGFSAGANLTFTVPMMLHDYTERLPLASEGSKNIPSFRIVSLVSFYPILNFSESRTLKRTSSKRPEKCLPPTLTNMFDASYMPDEKNQTSPFASPAIAPDDILKNGLPAENIGLFCCEWDMLYAEGLEFAKRLKNLGKAVECHTIPEVCHAFDKAPNPIGIDPKADEHYLMACKALRRAFADEKKNGCQKS
ncbi:MAG: hypothetical protein LQ351_007719 [Letrouitia transgressa]|nr:MAG: hypothetical protein LQ351_007719 [Letrouitia transgressa]